MSGPISQLAIHIRSSSNTGGNEPRPVRIPTSISTALMDKIKSAPDSREVFGKAEIEDLVDTLGSEQVKWGTVDEASFAALTLVFLYTEDCMAREEGIFRLYMVLDSMKTGNAQEIPRRTSFKNSAGEKTLQALTQFFLDTTRRHLLARRWTGLLLGELLETKENQRLFRRICAEGQNSYFLQIGRLLVDGRYRIPKHICGSLVSQLLDGTIPSARKQLLFAIMPRDAFELKPFEDGVKFPISTGAQWEDDFAEYLLEIECSREQAGLRIPMCFMAIAVKTGSTYIGKFGGVVCDISDILTLRIPTDADLAHHSWIDIDLANIQAVVMSTVDADTTNLTIYLNDYKEADYLFVLDMKPMKTPETLVIQVRSDEAEFIKNDLISAKAYRREKWNKQQGISKLARPWLEMQGEDTSPKRSISVEPVKQWERDSQRRREQSQMEIADSQALTQNSIFTLQEVDSMMQEAQKPEDQQEPATQDDTDDYFQPVQVQQCDRQPSIVPETQDENEAVSEMQTKCADSKNPSLAEASVPNNITQPALKTPTKGKESADLVPEQHNRKAVKSKGIPEALPVESPVAKALVIENSSGTKHKPETNKPKDTPKALPDAAPIITKQAVSPAKDGAIALQKPADKPPSTTKPAIKTYLSPQKWAGRQQNSETEKDIYDLTSDDDEPEPSKPTKKKPSAKGQNVKKPQAKASAKAPKKFKADIYDFDSGDESEPPKITGKRKGPAKGKQKASPAKRAKATPKTFTAKKGQKETLAGSTDNIFGSDDENEQQAQIQTPQSKEEMANKSKSAKEILTLPFNLPSKDAIKSDVSTKPSVPKNITGKFAKADPKLNTRTAVSNAKVGTKSKEKALVSMKHSFLDNEDTSKKLATKKKSVDKVERPMRSTRAQVKNYKIESSDIEDDEEESESKDTEYNNSWVPSSTSEEPLTSTPLPKVPELPEEATAINFLTSSPAKKITKSRKKRVGRNFQEEPMSKHARQEYQRPEEVASSSATKEVAKRPTAKAKTATSDVQEEITSTPQRMESLRLKEATYLSPTEEVNNGSVEKANPRTKPLKSNISPPRTTTITRKISSDRSESQSAKKALMADKEAPQELPKSGEDQINKKQSKLPRKLTPKDLEEIYSSPIWDETSDLSSIPDDDNNDDDEGSLIQINSRFDEPLTEGPVVELGITDPGFKPEPMANHISVPENTSLKKTPLTSKSKFDGEGKGKLSLKVFEPTINESEVNAVVGARAVGNIPFTVPHEIPEELRASNTSPKRIDELKKESDTKIGTTDTMGDKMPGQATKKISVQAATITTASMATRAPNSDAKSNNQVHKSSSDEKIPTKKFRNKATAPEMPAPTIPIPPKEDKFEAMYTRLKEAPVSPAAAKILQTRRKAVEDSKSEAKVLTKNDRPKNLVPGVIDGKSCSRDGKMSSPKSATLKTSASKELSNSPFKEGIFDEMYKRIKQDPTSPAKAPWLKTESNRTPIGQPKFKSPVRSSAVKETPKTPHIEHTSVVFKATITSKETTSEKSRYDKVLGNSSKADSGFAASSLGKKAETPRIAENNYVQSRQNREMEQNDGHSDGYGASQADDAANSSEDDLYSVPKNISVMEKKLETLRSAQTKAARRIIVVAGEEEDFIRSMTQRTTAKQDPPVTKSSGSDKKPIQRQKTDAYFPQRRMTVEAATGSPLPKLLSSQRAMESANSLRLSSTSISPPYSPPVENVSVKIKQERTFPSSPPIVNRKLQPNQSDIDIASNEPIFIDSDSSEDPGSTDGTPQVTPNPMDCQPKLPKVEKVEVSIDNKPLEEILSALSAGLNSPSSTKRPRFNDSSDKKVIKSVKSKVEPVFSGNKGPVELGSPLVFTKGSTLKRMGSREGVLPIAAKKSSGPPDFGSPPDYRKPTGHVSKAPEGSGSVSDEIWNMLGSSQANPIEKLKAQDNQWKKETQVSEDKEDAVSSETGRFYKSVQEHGLFRIKRERDSDDKEEKENRKPAKKRRSNDYDDSDSNSSTDDSDTESVSNVFINENSWRAALPDYHQETLAVLDRISHHWIQYLMSGEEKAGQIMKDYEAQADEVICFLQKSHRDEYNEFLTRVKAMREKLLQLCNNAREEARMMVPKGLDLGATKRNLKRKHEELEGGIEDMISTLMGSL